MKTNIFTFFAILMATVFSACSEHEAEEIAAAVATPKYWAPTSDFYTSEGGNYINVDIIFDDENVTKPARHQVSLQTEDTITAVGEYPFFCEEDLSEGREAKASMQYAYCYDKTNTIKVDGLVMSYEYNGKTYSLPCASTITVVGSMTEATETEAGLANSTVYTAVANSKKLAKGVQEFLAVKPDAPVVEPAEPIKWYPKSNTEAIVVFDNDSTATVKHNMGISGEELIKREGTTALSYNSLEAEAASSLTFKYNHNINNVVKVSGLDFVYKYNGKEYKNLPCAVELMVKGNHSVTTDKKDGYEFYELSKTVYSLFAGDVKIAEANQNFEVSKARTLVSEDISFEHGAYRTPSYSNDIITIICDNVMNVLQKYSDNTSNETEVDYSVSNLYNVAISVFVLNSKDALVGVSANFANGVAKVLGKNITVSHRSNNVSDIIFNGKNYRDDSRRPNCKPMAQSIYFKSENKAEITFDNGQTVEVDYNVKVAINFDGVLVKGWATDSYVDGGSGVAAHEGSYFHFVVNKNGAYTMYSAKVKENISVADFTATSVSENFVNTLSNEKPAAFTGKSSSTYDLGYINKIVKYSEDTYIIQYYNGNGKLDRTVGQSGAAIGSNYRYPIRGTWSEDTITVEGTTYYITGSQN